VVDAEHEKELALTDLRTENDVLQARLEAQGKSSTDREAEYEKELKLHKDRFGKEISRLTSVHDRDIQQREQHAKTQDEAYKYKLQYLELSQSELRAEKQRFQEKEREERKNLVALQAQVRELKSKYKQSVDLHEAFRQHVEAKDAARQMESSGWDIKKQALAAEHKLALSRLEQQHLHKQAELESQIERLQSDLQDSQQHVKDLNERLRELGDHSAPAPSSSKHDYDFKMGPIEVDLKLGGHHDDRRDVAPDASVPSSSSSYSEPQAAEPVADASIPREEERNSPRADVDVSADF